MGTTLCFVTSVTSVCKRITSDCFFMSHRTIIKLQFVGKNKNKMDQNIFDSFLLAFVNEAFLKVHYRFRASRLTAICHMR
jgi:hypothetical protein